MTEACQHCARLRDENETLAEEVRQLRSAEFLPDWMSLCDATPNGVRLTRLNGAVLACLARASGALGYRRISQMVADYTHTGDGFSRESLRVAVYQLRDAGFEIETINGFGYCISAPESLRISRLISGECIGGQARCAKRRTRRAYTAGEDAVLVKEWQAGRPVREICQLLDGRTRGSIVTRAKTLKLAAHPGAKTHIKGL